MADAAQRKADAKSEKAAAAQHRALAAPLMRARLAAAIRERAGLLKPVRLRGRDRAGRWSRALLRWADTRGRLADPSLPANVVARRSRWLARLLRVITGTRTAPAMPLVALAEVRARHHVERLQPVAGFVTSSVSDTWVVRLSILLRLMRRHEASLDLLVRRWQTGLPSPGAVASLARALEEAGEAKAATALGPAATPPLPGLPDAPPDRAPRSRRTHAVVMLSMFDSEIFRASLDSLVRSDVAGEILVVEDGHSPDESCRETCARFGVSYRKCPDWRGSAAAMNLGLSALAPDTEVVVFTHSDVLWPRAWFDEYDRAWDEALASGSVGLVNLGYLQYKRRLDSGLTDLFVRGRYDDIVWLLRQMRDVPELLGEVQDCQVRAGEHPFGLSRDPWNDWLPDLRQMTGRFSVAASFPYRTWQELGGFCEDLPYGFDVELQWGALVRRQWMLFLDNPPLVHLVSSDTRALSPADRATFVDKVHQTYEAFESRYGTAIEHFLNLYFSETTIVHRDAIVAAANAGAFERVDPVFDDFAARLRDRRLENCELTWCRSRAACKYTGEAPAPVFRWHSRPDA